MDQMPGAEGVSSSVAAASQKLQAFTSEMQQMGQQSVEQSTQLMEALRNAKSIEEVVSLQTTFMQQAFTRYTEFTRRLGELMMSVRPM